VARYKYQLVHLPQHFPDTFVLFCHDPHAYSVYDHSRQGPVKPLYKRDFGGLSTHDLLAQASAQVHEDPHRAKDREYWWPRIQELNRSRL
jgi:hypothetical protein